MHVATDVVCGEIGSSDEQRWSEPLVLDAQDVRALEALESDGIVETRATPSGLHIAGVDHVGTVLLPTRRRLHIRPKIGTVALLDWLAYVGDTPPVPPRASGDSFALRGSLTEAIAAQFLAELELLTHRSLRPQYAPQRDESTAVRGRILPHALAGTYHRLPSLPQSRRVRTLDTPHHRLLARALDRVPQFLPATERLAALRREWDRIPRGPLEAARLVADAAPCPPGYAAAVRLASLVLLGVRPADHVRATAGRLLVSLSNVWERALRRMCAQVAPATGWRPFPDADRTRCWDDGPGLRDPLRWMTADVILSSGARRWVLDAKYKRGYGDEERNDRFQMTAYAMAFDARRATLAYPTAETERPRWRLLLAGQIGGQPTTIDSLELPMAKGPAACREALLQGILSLGGSGVKPAAAQAILSPP